MNSRPAAHDSVSRRPVRLRDIADDCGLNVMTVSFALRGIEHRVSPATLKRVQAAAAKLGYDPQQAQVARRLRSMRSGSAPANRVIGLSFPLEFLETRYFTEILRGIGLAATPAGFSVLIQPPEDLATAGAIVPPVIARGDVDGFLFLTGIGGTGAILRALRQSLGFGDRPVVSILEPLGDASCVLTDDERGAFELTRHLLDLGHREMFLVYQGTHQHLQRHSGCRRAFHEAGFDPDRCIRRLSRDCVVPVQQPELLRQALSEFPDCRACFAGNDHVAVQLAGAAAALGLDVPRDLSIVGFDDAIAWPGADGRNRLTTVRLPLEDVGRRAAALLIEQALHPHQKADAVTLPVELLVRASSAPPPARRSPAATATSPLHHPMTPG